MASLLRPARLWSGPLRCAQPLSALPRLPSFGHHAGLPLVRADRTAAVAVTVPSRGLATNAVARPSAITRGLAFLRTRQGMVATTGVVVAVVVGRVAYDTMHAFIHLDFYTVAEVGFAAGFLAAGTGFGALSYINRALTIPVEKLMTESLELVKRSPAAFERYGNGLTDALVAGVRVYEVDGGRLGTVSTGLVGWKNTAMRLMYQIALPDGRVATVAVEAHRRLMGMSKLIFDVIVVSDASGGELQILGDIASPALLCLLVYMYCGSTASSGPRDLSDHVARSSPSASGWSSATPSSSDAGAGALAFAE
jgi:hypothetical protein